MYGQTRPIQPERLRGCEVANQMHSGFSGVGEKVGSIVQLNSRRVFMMTLRRVTLRWQATGDGI